MSYTILIVFVLLYPKYYLIPRLYTLSNIHIKFYISYNIINKLGGNMYRSKSNRPYNEYNNCNSQGDKLIILGAIISAIIYQEIQNDDDLNTIGNLLIAIGSNLVLGVGQRSSCNNNLNQNNLNDNSNNQDIPLVDDTNLSLQSQRSSNNKKIKKVKKVKKIKKVKKLSRI